MEQGYNFRRAFFIGLIASCASAALMALLRISIGGLTLPEVLIDAVTRIIPLGIFSAAVDTFGPWAKRLLVFGLAVMLLFSGGLVAMAAQRFLKLPNAKSGRRVWAAAPVLALVLWLLTMIVILPASRRGFFALSVSPWPAAMVLSWLASAAVFSTVFILLTKRQAKPPQPTPGESNGTSRRHFIKVLGWTAGGIAAASAGGLLIWKMVSLISTRITRLLSQDKISTEITPNSDFYYVAIGLTSPPTDVAAWKLDINGLVQKPLSLDYAQLKAMSAVSQYQTLECISNPVGGNLIGNAVWKGVRLQDLLALTGIQPSATKAVLYGIDNYTDSITVTKAMEPGTVLAYEMNGAPLPADHGFPARLLVPDIYGMKNVKWLNRIELVDVDYEGYWELEGWSNIAEIRTMSRIDVPSSSDTYGFTSDAQLGGVAFAGDRGISWVELSLDGGKTWNRALIKPAVSKLSWVIWTFDWRPAQEGTYDLVVRAADGAGEVQTDAVADSLPNGATGYHDVSIELVNPL